MSDDSILEACNFLDEAFKILDEAYKETKEYERQVEAGLCRCDYRTWLNRRKKGQYHYEESEEGRTE